MKMHATRGFTLTELAVAMLLMVMLLGLSLTIIRSAPVSSENLAASRAVRAFFEVARQQAAVLQAPVAVLLPPGDELASLHLLVGEDKPALVDTLQLAKEYPNTRLALGPASAGTPPDLGLHDPATLYAGWGDEHPGHRLIFTAEGQVLTPNWPMYQGRFHLLVATGLEQSGPPDNLPLKVGPSHTVSVGPAGDLQLESGAGAPVGSPEQVSENLLAGPPQQGPPLATRPEPPVLERVDILPDPERLMLPLGVDAAISDDGYLTLLVTADSPEGWPLYCSWNDQQDEPRVSGVAAERMSFDPESKRWIARWHWRPPDTSTSATYEITCQVRDSWMQPAVERVSATVIVSVAPPGPRMVFASDRLGPMCLFSISHTGTDERMLSEPFPGVLAEVGSWSPDGERLVFYSERDGGELFAVNSDGSDLRRLTFNSTGEGSPEWSPRGSMIVYNSPTGANRDIWLINGDGTNERRLTNTPAVNEVLTSLQGFGYLPASFSPDERWVTFEEAGELKVIATDGSGQIHSLSSGLGWASNPNWSPTGNRVAMVSGGEIWVYDVASGWGGTPAQLTSGVQARESAQFSPDGTRIAFVRLGSPGTDIAVVDAATGAVQKTINVDITDNTPAWVDDGHLSFISGARGSREIYLLRLADDTVRNLTNHPGDEFFCGWTR